MRFLSPFRQLLVQVVPHLDYATNTSFHFLSKSLFTNHPVIWCYIIQIIESLTNYITPWSTLLPENLRGTQLEPRGELPYLQAPATLSPP